MSDAVFTVGDGAAAAAVRSVAIPDVQTIKRLFRMKIHFKQSTVDSRRHLKVCLGHF